MDGAVSELNRLAKVERTAWDEVVATFLMTKCNEGSVGKGGNKRKRGVASS